MIKTSQSCDLNFANSGRDIEAKTSPRHLNFLKQLNKTTDRVPDTQSPTRHWPAFDTDGGPRPPEIMSDHQNIQTQWSDGPPKFSTLRKIVTWPKNLSNRRHSRPIIQETRYRSRPFSRNKTSVYNHAGHELLRSRLTIRFCLFTELKICVHNHAGYELLRPRSTINPADVVSKRHPPQLAPVAETLVCCLPALIWLSSQTSGVQSICDAEKVSARHF